MRVEPMLIVLLLTGCSQAVLYQPSYEEKLGWAHEHGLSIEGAASESDGWKARLKLNDRCDGVLTFESDDAEDPGSYRLAVTQGGKILATVEEAEISTFAADFLLGNVTTAIKEACFS